MKFIKRLLLVVLFIFSLNILVGCNNNKIDTLLVGVHEIEENFLVNANNYVSDLVHGYSTLVKTENGEYVWDTNIVLTKAPEVKFDDDGNKTYHFTLRKNLEWNNGSKITAKDYVASILLFSSSEWNTLSPSNVGSKLLGYNEYRKGIKSKNNYTSIHEIFRGVRLTDDYTFSLTIDKKYIPNFYESAFVAAKPIYLESFLPGFDIKDDGEGAYLKSSDSLNVLELLQINVFSENGEKLNPKVTCGPYNFISFDKNNIFLEVNPHYQGNYEKKKPKIEIIEIKEITPLTDVEQVIAGSVDLVIGINDPNKIKIAKETTNVGLCNYLENGFRFIGIANDKEPTSYPEVRRAIAYLIDRNKLLTYEASGYGAIINAPYSKDDWYYLESKNELESKLATYSQSINSANIELNMSPYKYEEDGETLYNPEKAANDYFRHDADGNILEITQCIKTKNMLSLDLSLHAWKVGIKFQYDEVESEEFIERINEKHYHLYELSISFDDFDPYLYWHSDVVDTDLMAVSDMIIDEMVLKMHRAQSKEDFVEAFINFSTRWNRILPCIPLYSSEYYDVYNKKVKGLKTNAHWTWANDICDIYID
ncbi:MAG TPA: hypothetical protein GXZ48_05385 [Acholeplasmataceae bacterium]|nr:hypothetical protein [Acholeplasmataceae bacterium]